MVAMIQLKLTIFDRLLVDDKVKEEKKHPTAGAPNKTRFHTRKT